MYALDDRNFAGSSAFWPDDPSTDHWEDAPPGVNPGDSLLRSTPVGSLTDTSSTIVQRLQRFATFPRLKQEACVFIVERCWNDELFLAASPGLRELRDIFSRKDATSRGYLTATEFSRLLAGFDITKEEGLQLRDGVDIYKSDTLRASVWSAAMVNWRLLQVNDVPRNCQSNCQAITR